MKKNWVNIILIAVFFIGLSVLLYPTFSDWWNSKTQTRAIANYNTILEEMSEEDYTSLFEAADRYNEQIRGLSEPFLRGQGLEEYEEILNIGGDGIMGYISIEKIDVKLPIYHGTSDKVLNVAVGHLEGSSLPVGGESTHAVLSAHRGLPSAKLFTNLDKLVVGDLFTIQVLNRTLTYEVDQILIVEPDELDALQITEGADYCTLLTCTPYGINTHRLLVRGHRVENIEGHEVIVTPDAFAIDPVLVAPLVAAPILLVLLILLLWKTRKKPEKKKKERRRRREEGAHEDKE